MTDVSMQGSRLVIQNPKIKGANVVINFYDEGTPIGFPALDNVGVSGNMNGEMITWTRYRPATFQIVVTPGSKADKSLRTLLYLGSIGGTGGNPVDQSAVYIPTALWIIPGITTNGVPQGEGISSAGELVFTFNNGRMSGGTPAIGSNGEGKASGCSYSFVFEQWQPPKVG